MSEAIVRANELIKRFGDFTAVDKVSFEIFPQEVVGYLGPNGSGKTTTIRMLLGLLLPSEGSSTVMGFDSATQTEQVRAGVGYMSQKFALYDELTVWENLSFYAGVYGVKEESHLHNTLARVGLTGQEKESAGDLPVGWRQRLALGTAIVHRPKVLFLDEPTSGVDPMARRQFWDLIYELVEEGMTALVTTHYMDEAEYCQRVGIMRSGKLMANDSPSNLKTKTFTELAWNVFVEDLLLGITLLEKMPGVSRVGLAGNHIRVISAKTTTANQIEDYLKKTKLKDYKIEATQPSLEDVFLTLAKG